MIFFFSVLRCDALVQFGFSSCPYGGDHCPDGPLPSLPDEGQRIPLLFLLFLLQIAALSSWKGWTEAA